MEDLGKNVNTDNFCLHLVPRFLCCTPIDRFVSLVELSIPELGITLKNDVDIVVCKPYPNKNYLVVKSKKSRKSVNGILVKVSRSLFKFTVNTIWHNKVLNSMMTHKVEHHLLEPMTSVFNLVSDDMTFLYAFHDCDWTDRFPHEYENFSPVQIQPTMCSVSPESGGVERNGVFEDNLDEAGNVIYRKETYFHLPIESKRLFDDDYYKGINQPSADLFFEELRIFDRKGNRMNFNDFRFSD